MINEDVLMTGLDKLREYMGVLDNIRKHTEPEYLKNPFVYGAGERFLYLAIDCTINIGNHIIADMGYRKPETYNDAFDVLYENDVISSNLKRNLKNMVSFKNILLYDYIGIDRSMVYKIITEDIGDLRSFAKEIVDYFYD